MYKKILFLVLTLLAVKNFGQNNFGVLDSNQGDESFLTFKFNQFDLKTVQTPHGIEKILKAENTFDILKAGAPDLPKFTTSLIIPDDGVMNVEVIYSRYTDYTDINVAPSKGNLLRTVNPDDVPYTYGREYEQDAFFPNNSAQLNSAYIFRDFRGQALQIFPFQYNPITKVLRVYTEIRVKVFKNGNGGENVFNRTLNNDKIATDFNEIYKKQFINYTENLERYAPIGEAGKMLIICHDAWTSNVQPLVDWKNKIGRPTEMVTVTQAGGTAAAIKTYVANYYNTNGLTFLLLIGDATQVPTNSGTGLGGDSDNAYGYISGNDHYQELIVGRFSSETAAHVDTQVLRTIEYEHGNQLTSGWLNKILSVASDQGPGDDNELDYQHLRNIQPDLLGFTYENPVFEVFDGSQGGFDASGDATSAQVASALNTGAGIANYTGHGSNTGWVTSGFSISNVNALTNHNKLPFIFDVACVNGNYVGQTCFAESWLRAQNANEPTGAVAINASTINQSWSPPMIAQDEMVDILTGLSSTGFRRTFGSIIVNGYFKMNEESSDFNMTDTWTCFGDPSLLVRTDDPVAMTVTHSNVMVVGTSTFDVNCNFDTALATISHNGQIIGSTNVTSGIAQIPVAGVVPGQVLTLAIVGFNQITYLADITVISPSGSYLVVNSYVNSINYGETKDIDIAIKNVGADASINAQTTVTTTNPNAGLANANYNYGTINADAISTGSVDANTLTVANNIPDQTPIALNISMTDDSNQVWNETKNVIVNAPSFTIGSMTVNDASGNNDGILDPGETADLIITVTNTGHASVSNVIGNLSSTSSDLILNNVVTSPYVMDVNGVQTFVFNVTALSTTPVGTNATVHFYVTGGTENQYNNQKDYNFVIGFVPSYCTVSTTYLYDEFISRVQFITIDNSSTGVVSYSDYSSISTTVNAGQTYPIIVTNGYHFNSDQISCWVDWNYDGDFNDDGETYVLTYAASTGVLGIGTGNITIPTTAHLGNNRMRIRLVYTGTNSPCGNSSYGETEDYNVIVTSNLGNHELTEDEIQIFPNPNNGTFEIQWSSIDTDKANSLEIFNISGQLIYKTNQLNQSNTISLQPNTGIYLLKLTSDNNVLIKKIIVE